MPKHKTTYIAIGENAAQGASEIFSIIDWTVEAWNVEHAARLVRERGAAQSHQHFALVPATKFHQYRS